MTFAFLLSQPHTCPKGTCSLLFSDLHYSNDGTYVLLRDNNTNLLGQKKMKIIGTPSAPFLRPPRGELQHIDTAPTHQPDYPTYTLTTNSVTTDFMSIMSTDPTDVLLKVFSLPYKMAACALLLSIIRKYGGCVSELHANGKHGMNAILSFPGTAASQLNMIIQQVKKIPTPAGGKCVGVEKLPHSYKADPARKKADASRRRSRLLMFPVFVTKNGSRTMVKPDYLLQLKLAFAIRDEIAQEYKIEPDVCQVKYAEKHNAQLEVMLQFATPTEALMVRQRQLIDGTEKKIGSFVMYCHTGQQYQKRAFYAPSLPTRPNAFARKDSPSSNPSSPGLQKGSTENSELDEELSFSSSSPDIATSPDSSTELSSCADSTSCSETPSNGDLQVCCYPTTPLPLWAQRCFLCVIRNLSGCTSDLETHFAKEGQAREAEGHLTHFSLILSARPRGLCVVCFPCQCQVHATSALPRICTLRNHSPPQNAGRTYYRHHPYDTDYNFIVCSLVL